MRDIASSSGEKDVIEEDPALESLENGDGQTGASVDGKRYLTAVESIELQKPRQWEDIKSLLDDVSEVLHLGDLVHGDYFNLGDAMCCLEIMHPKMDSGMVKEEKTTLDDLINSGLLPRDDQLSLAEIIGYMDQVLCCEMTYYQGQPIPQTVFTCLYLHRPLELTTVPSIRAFSIGTLKTIGHVRQVVTKADVFEEEDFGTHLFEFALCNNTLDSDTMQLLKTAEAAAAQNLSSAAEPEKPLWDAIHSRIRFRRHLFLAHVYLLRFNEKNFETAKKCLTIAQEALSKIKASTELGQVPTAVFDARVTRHIMSSSPPRSTSIYPKDKSFAWFEQQLRQLLVVCELPKVEPKFSALSEFYLDFSYLVPDVVARSRLHSCFLINEQVQGTVSVLDFAIEAMKRFAVPPVFFENIESKEKENVNLFCSRVGTVLCLYFRYLLNNRSRLRRKIAHLLEDCVVLQTEADELDMQITNDRGAPHRIFGAYILELKEHVMALWLYLGFELDVYPKSEYPAIYWYLDYILQVNIRNQTGLLELTREDFSHDAKTVKKADKQKKLEKQLQYSRSVTSMFIIPHYLLASHLFLAKGMFRFLSGLRKLGLLDLQQYPFGDPEVRFLKRFSLFHRLQFQPQPLYYQAYRDVFYSDFAATSAEDMFRGAIDFFQQAKAHLEKVLHNAAPPPTAIALNEVKSLLRVAISNTLQCQVIYKDMNSAPKYAQALFSFAVHHYYPVVTVIK